MPCEAPRLLWRFWRAPARGAWLVLCFWLLLLGAGGAVAQQIVAASYDGPTTRYPHGVLGDDVEYSALEVTLSDGRRLRVTLDTTLVFEDIAPRLADVDGDGLPEIVTVESHEALGARLTVWRYGSAGLRRVASTPHIGTRFRWLAPVGVADLDGDGAIEIAYIDRPHLAKTLRVWRFEDGSLRQIADLPGLSNHRIGWDYIEGGLRRCGAGPEMVMADGAWRNVMLVRLSGDGLQAEAVAPYSASAVAQVLACG
ncbi:MAG: VCBS repeat-containing protein [Paracoccaceae bacterium]|nr:VCBS repeat-containing protein [Paracoccaceae bacterium]